MGRWFLNIKYCDPRCRDHWVGDKFCDNACNVKECGFDAGDCGIENFNQLFSAYVTEEVFKHLKIA